MSIDAHDRWTARIFYVYESFREYIGSVLGIGLSSCMSYRARDRCLEFGHTLTDQTELDCSSLWLWATRYYDCNHCKTLGCGSNGYDWKGIFKPRSSTAYDGSPTRC